MTWIEAFLWTCALETPVYVVLLGRSFRAWWAPVALSVSLQLATHPLLWLLFPRDVPYAPAFLAFEAGVALVEGLLAAGVLRRVADRRPLLRGLLAGLLANALSATIGLLFLNPGPRQAV